MANNRELSQFASTVGHSGGNIGIGTDNPLQKLHLFDTTSSNIYVHTHNNGTGSTAGVYFRTSDSSTADGFFKTAIVLEDDGTSWARGKLHILQDNTADSSNATLDDSVLTINQSGNIGIGENSPYYKFHLKTNNAQTSLTGGTNGNWGSDGIRIENESATGGSMVLAHFRNYDADWHIGGKYVGANDSDFLFLAEGSEKLRITSDGEVLISNSTNRFLSLDRTNASSGSGEFNLNVESNSQATVSYDDGSQIVIGTSSSPRSQAGFSERLRITSDGKVGVKNTSPDGVGIDVKADRTTNYSATTDQRSLAHIIARNGSDAANRFSSISLVNGGGTQAEASINLVQAGNYIGHLTFKMRSGASSWAERLRIFSSGVVKATKGFLTGGSNGAGMIELASSSGSTVIDTGLSINASNGGGAMMVLASRNTSDQTNTAAGMYLLDFRYNGNHVPGVTFIGGDNICTFNKTAGNNLSVTCSSGNWCVSAFFGGYGIGNQLT
jgi:hypothetical protein